MDSESITQLRQLATRFRGRHWHTDEAQVVKTDKGGVMAWANSKLCGEYLEATCPARILELLTRLEELGKEAATAKKKAADLRAQLNQEVAASKKKAAELRAKANALAEIALFFEMELELKRSPLALTESPFDRARKAAGLHKTTRAKMILKTLNELETLLAKRRAKLAEELTADS